ncbi:Hypp2977 [Branchiostoma lanceolatum]|uniref:Hypp2977 protein n=1 Tax=Branchiostoma lanceolatum TaxID=7740 RepID=A0A8J9ZVJ5_BRALA|nr:Hypp2977 [Branchiostoma lanceolatum]CAH1264409.1 Hypp2977 [Branchiostoma lanceolatum]
MIFLRQQQLALRKALQQSEQEYLAIKKKVEQEEKEKKEREHMELQRARSKKQLESAKTSNIEKLLDELEDKDQRLRHLTEEQEKTSKLSRLSMERAEKTVHAIRSQLDHERSLKLDAFQRVDELQAQVYDFESGTAARPFTANTTVSRQTSTRTPQPRVRSGKSRSSGFSDISLWPPSSGPLWPPAAGPGPIRSLTPGPPAKPNGVAKLQRPKTVTGRLKSRIAESLIAELERSTEDTLVQLQQLQHQK